MITEWEMYWITRFDYLRGAESALFWGVGALAGCAIAFIVCCWADGKEGEPFPWKPIVVFSIPFVFALLCGAAWILTPSTKEYCAIKIIPAIANNEDVQAIGEDLPKLAREWLEELRPKNSAAKTAKED